MLRLNNSINDGGSGGGVSPSPTPAEPVGSGRWGRFIKSAGCYIKILTNIRGNTNTEYYIEFALTNAEQSDVWAMCIEDVIGLQIVNDQINDFNFGNLAGSPIDDVEAGKIYKYKCVISGTTRTWYSPDSNGDWVAHEYQGAPCVFTDEGINIESTNNQYLNNAGNTSTQNPDSLINLQSFKVVNNDEEVFSFETAERDTDYEVYGPIALTELL